MDRSDILKRILYPKCKTALEFNFDTLTVNPLLSYITIQDIAQLHNIATSIKYSSKPKEKYAMINKILEPRGFKKMASGTNRVVYRHLNDYRVVLKVAIDRVGLFDNGSEYRVQHMLKPFVAKCFEATSCGTVGLFERVVPITSREEFMAIASDIFDLINNLTGKYVIDDIGEKYYMNYGLREGFGPVLLDYPYVYELDGAKLICNVVEPSTGQHCRGEIDYDLGYNNLICTKCGKRYLATELKTEETSDKPKIIIKGEDTIMKVVLKRGNEVISKLNSDAPISTNTIKPRKEFDTLKVRINRNQESKPDEEFKVQPPVRDEVTLVSRVVGTPKRKSKDIDAEAIRNNKIAEMNTEKISVNLDSSNEKSHDTEENNIKVVLKKEEDEKIELKPEHILDELVDDACIINYEYSKAIEEVRESCEISIDEPEEESVEVCESCMINLNENPETSEPILVSNYKTDSIRSKISDQFANPEEKEKNEIPELIINERKTSENDVLNNY